jgi:hypothetical protein
MSVFLHSMYLRNLCARCSELAMVGQAHKYPVWTFNGSVPGPMIRYLHSLASWVWVRRGCFLKQMAVCMLADGSAHNVQQSACSCCFSSCTLTTHCYRAVYQCCACMPNLRLPAFRQRLSKVLYMLVSRHTCSTSTDGCSLTHMSRLFVQPPANDMTRCIPCMQVSCG